MKIIIDHREKQSGIAVELAKKGFDIEYKQLISADFILHSKTSDGEIIEVWIERKTVNDFLNSIIDNRILNQLIILKQHSQVPVLIIEGTENIYAIRNFHPNAIRGMLASIAIDFQIPILHTKNIKDTASLITIIAKRLEKPRRHFSLLKKRKPTTIKEQQEFIVESLPGVGPGLSKTLLKKFKRVAKIFAVSESELQKIEKLGPKKAKAIRKAVNSYYSKGNSAKIK